MDDEPWKDFNRMGRRQQLPPLTLWCNIVGKQWLYGKSFRGVVWGEEEEEEERGGKQSERDGFNYYYPKNIQSLATWDNDDDDDDVVVADVLNLHIIRSNKQKKMKKNTKGNSTKPHHDLFVYHGMFVYY
ncbi:hypothetical protein IV203_030419 [Nitzschia inconspicua]|uniref:Uncharacterized protein n=1 Tax=Nitzschia inconspicua TaxID=303405 RepID=A0A9K3K8T6_9STRA|nr:hypothetical protein IV203_028330 [Nitzschia inconspicua]KAG7339006.1 hypothetical protein IV203_028343 [Nitzschia inconspicua]KAG7367748.1 hypothetical protein IV203_030419 [Nitzschia inconspicua]